MYLRHASNAVTGFPGNKFLRVFSTIIKYKKQNQKQTKKNIFGTKMGTIFVKTIFGTKSDNSKSINRAKDLTAVKSHFYMNNI